MVAGERSTIPEGLLDHVALALVDGAAADDVDVDGIASALEGAGWPVLEQTPRMLLMGPERDACKLTLMRARADAHAGPSVTLQIAGGAASSVGDACGQGGIDAVVTAAGDARDGIVGVAIAVSDEAAVTTWVEQVDATVIGAGADPPWTTLLTICAADRAGEAPASWVVDHLGIAVASRDECVRRAASLPDTEITLVDGPTTRAAFLTGPSGLRIECIEHLPAFFVAPGSRVLATP